MLFIGEVLYRRSVGKLDDERLGIRASISADRSPASDALDGCCFPEWAVILSCLM